MDFFASKSWINSIYGALARHAAAEGWGIFHIELKEWSSHRDHFVLAQVGPRNSEHQLITQARGGRNRPTPHSLDRP